MREFAPRVALRGYDRDTVDDFLKEVAASYDAALKDLEAMQRRVRELQRASDESDPSWADETDSATSIEALRRELRTYREREHAVGVALVVAQKSANELRSKAEKETAALRAATVKELERGRNAAKREAERIVAEARLQAKKLEDETSSQRSSFEQELNRLRSLQEATRQDLSEFLTQALRGLEEARADEHAQPSSSPR